jgi:hypothetical protein
MLRAAANRLLSQFARLDPPWGQVSRLRRERFDEPVSGGPDTLRSIDLQPKLDSAGTSAAQAGDSFTFISTWTKDGRWQAESLVPFGSSKMDGAPHYADQAPLFADEKLKMLPLSGPALTAEATQMERPGKPPPPKGGTIAPPADIAPVPSTLGVTSPANAAARKSASPPPLVLRAPP